MNKIIKTILLGMTVGFLGGLLGMAGSIYLLFGLLALNIVDTQRQAAGITLLYTSIPLTLGATYIYYKENQIDFKISIILIVTAFIFTIIGAKVNFMINKKITYILLGITTIFIGIYFLNKSFNIKFNKE